MQKEAESLLTSALAFQKSGATDEQIRIVPYLTQGKIQIIATLPVVVEGLEIKVAQISE